MVFLSGCAASAILPLALAAPAILPPELADKDVQAKLKAAVTRILPEGWSITQARMGVSPPDWFTDNPKAGFLIEGGAGEGEAFRICFLPHDWIGIRKPVSHEPKSLYC